MIRRQKDMCVTAVRMYKYYTYIQLTQSTMQPKFSLLVISWLLYMMSLIFVQLITPDRQQSKMLLTIDERRSNMDTNSVFDWATNGNQKLCF